MIMLKHQTKKEKWSRVDQQHIFAMPQVFSSTKLVGVVGKDFKQEHIDMLKNLNADLEGMQIKEGKPSPTAAGMKTI